jgi:hypothetical protein
MSIDFLLVANAEARPESVLIVPRIPDDVINYIYEHNLYRELDLAKPSKGKEQATAGTSTS